MNTCLQPVTGPIVIHISFGNSDSAAAVAVPQHANSQHIAASCSPSTYCSLDELWKRFEVTRAGRIKPRTMESYYYCFRVFRKTFPDLATVDQVTKEIAEKFVSIRSKQVRPATVNSNLRHLRGIWTFAIKQGLVSDNVFASVEKLKEPPKKITVISQKEQKKLLCAVNTQESLSPLLKQKMKAIILLAVQAGLRSEEIRHLRWKDIDLESGEIRITCRDDWTTKNGKNRTAYILEDALKMLKKLYFRNKRNKPDDMPFHFPSRHSIGRHFKKIAKKARVTCTLHDLRRTCASRLSESGVNVLVATEILGHSSPVTTQKYYTRISPQVLKQAVVNANKPISLKLE